MEPRNFGHGDAGDLRLRNRVVPRAPPVAPRREARSPRRRSPSEGAVSAFSQARNAPRLDSHGAGMGYEAGTSGVSPLGARGPSMGSLQGGIGATSSRQGLASEVGRQEVEQGTLGQRMEQVERMLEHFLHQREVSNTPVVQQIMPPAHVHVPPSFSGHKPKSWLLQIEQYFTIIGVPEEERLGRIVCHLTGAALERFNAIAERTPHALPTTWEEFKTYLITSYGSVSATSVVQRIKEIKFAGNFRAVVEKFEDALAQGEAPSERQLVSLFITRFPLPLVLATRHEHFETWVEARSFLENEYRAWERTLQDYCHDASEEYRVQARQHPDVVALGLAGVKEKREVEPKKHPFASGKIFEVKPKANAVKAERANTAGGTMFNGGSLKCYACTGVGHRAKECPSTNPATKRDGQRCRRCGGIGHWATACPSGSMERQFRVLPEGKNLQADTQAQQGNERA